MSSDDPVPLEGPTPPAAEQRACRDLVDDLPATVADQPRREVEPADGWGAAWGDPPIQVECGVAEPPGFNRTSACTTVNGIDWFIPDRQLEASEPTDLTVTLVNRQPRVRVRLPAEHWPPATTLADLSDVVRKQTRRTGRCR